MAIGLVRKGVVVVSIEVRDCQGMMVRNSEPAFLDLIYCCSPVASLIRNKYCWPNDALIPCDVIPLQNTDRPSARETIRSSTDQAPRNVSSSSSHQWRERVSKRIPDPIIGGFLPKFGNAVQSDHLVINTASALGCVHPVFRVSDTPRDLNKGPGCVDLATVDTVVLLE
jgi:hypothetical protein